MGAVFFSFFSIYYHLTDFDRYITILSDLGAFLLCSSIILSKANFYNLSRIITIISASTILFFSSGILGKESNTHYWLVAILVYIIPIFKREESFKQIFLNLYVLILAVTLEFLDFNIFNYRIENQDAIITTAFKIINLVGSFIAILSSSVVYFSLISKAKIKLSASEQKLHQEILIGKLLSEIGDLTNRTKDTTEIYQPCIKSICTHTPWDAGEVIYITEKEDHIEAHASGIIYTDDDRKTDALRSASTEYGEGLKAQYLEVTALQKKATIVKDIVRKKYIAECIKVQTSFKTLLSIPIVLHGKTFAVINLYSETSQDIDKTMNTILEAVCSQIASVEERKINIESSMQKETEKVEMWNQLEQSSRLAYIGSMGASIAHELSNPLTAIIGMANLIESAENDPAVVQDRVGKILKAANRMKKLVKHLTGYARGNNDEEIEELDYNSPIKDSLIILQKQLDVALIKIDLDLSNSLPMVKGDHNQLESIFQNLLSNSRDAFLNLEDNRNKIISIKSELINDKIKIVYTDNAGGMNKNIVDNIFKPFYTTKKRGVGTGLGMSITLGVVEKHKGTISASSVIGGGTTFIIEFPTVEELNIKPLKVS